MTQKKILIDDLVDIIRPGNRIFISSGPTTPIEEITYILNTNHPNFDDIEFIQLSAIVDIFQNATFKKKYRVKTFHIGQNISTAFHKGNIDFIPTNGTEIPYLFVSGAIGVDIAIIRTSPPDAKNNVSLGIVNDISRTVIEHSRIVIAEINSNMPTTCGSTKVPIGKFDYVIESQSPLFELSIMPYDDVYDKIGRHICHIIQDGSTLSMGIGKIFNAITNYIKHKRDLQIRSHIVSDWIIDLMKEGAIREKNVIRREAPIIITSCIGSSKLYKFVHNNSQIEFHPLLQSSYQTKIQKLKKLISILNVSKIDISGDTVVPSHKEFQIAGFDSKLSFSTAATYSRDGKAIVALRSEDKNGNSNIVITHANDQDQIRSTFGSTHYVVTEYGYANIFGKSIRERAIALIDIAHPRHREYLIKEAKNSGFMFPDQIYHIQNALNYPYETETMHSFDKNLLVTFRPIKPTDEEMMRRLFYEFSDESKYMRYFSVVRTMPHTRIQHYVNIDYEKTVSIVGIIQQRGIERIIAECRYAYYEAESTYEMAFVVDEEFQRKGVATFMLNHLLTIAENRNIHTLTAYVLNKNEKMLRVLKKATIFPDIIQTGDETHCHFHLADPYNKVIVSSYKCS